jgi:hypothetical protein
MSCEVLLIFLSTEVVEPHRSVYLRNIPFLKDTIFAGRVKAAPMLRNAGN